MKIKNIKLSVFIVISLSAILILLSASYFFISRNSIKRLGNYAVEVDLKNTKNVSSELFLEITNRTADQYSKYFDDAKDLAFILARQIEHSFSSKHLINVCSTIELKPYKERNFFVNNITDSITAYYWGDSKKVPGKIIKKNQYNCRINSFYKKRFSKS